MALELNGTTGVSLVQDGVVQTADLADDAVTAAKIGSLPAGSVLQVVKENFFTKTVVNTTLSTVIFTGSNISLSSTSSKVLVIPHFSVGFDQGGSVKIQYSTDSGSSWSDISTADMGSTDNGTSMNGVSSLGFHMNLGDSAGRFFSMQTSFAELISPNSNSFQYRIIAAGSTSGYGISFNRRSNDANWGGLSHIVVMEIAG